MSARGRAATVTLVGEVCGRKNGLRHAEAQVREAHKRALVLGVVVLLDLLPLLGRPLYLHRIRHDGQVEPGGGTNF